MAGEEQVVEESEANLEKGVDSRVEKRVTEEVMDREKVVARGVAVMVKEEGEKVVAMVVARVARRRT
jgi:hypothetical protein